MYISLAPCSYRYTEEVKYVVGIDEVGRGPLAGPVSIGIVVCRKHFSIDGITDSKKMSEEARERVFLIAEKMREDGLLNFGVFSSPSDMIDAEGIERAISDAVRRGLKELVPDSSEADVVLDGRLSAPDEYYQQSIIRGDFLVPAISLASIVAKVTRDRYMSTEAESMFPGYGLAKHKGYGTADHIAAIKKLGPSTIHRTSYLRSFEMVR